jgi:hypothetical protein
MLETGASGSVGGKGGNILVYPAGVQPTQRLSTGAQTVAPRSLVTFNSDFTSSQHQGMSMCSSWPAWLAVPHSN